MKRNILLSLLVCLLLITLTSCKSKVISTNKDNYSKYINEFYQYQIGKKEGYVAVDLRDTDIYAEGHIKGFISYNYQNSTKEEFINYITGMYNKKTTIFLLDSDGSLIEEVSNILQELEYKKIYIYTDGYESLIELAKSDIFIETGLDNCGC